MDIKKYLSHLGGNNNLDRLVRNYIFEKYGVVIFSLLVLVCGFILYKKIKNGTLDELDIVLLMFPFFAFFSFFTH